MDLAERKNMIELEENGILIKKEKGNGKRVRNYQLQCNFKDKAKEQEILSFFSFEDNIKKLVPDEKTCNYIVFQLERGEECGTLHIQAYVELTRAMTWEAFIKFINNTHEIWQNGHIEQVKFDKASLAYSVKQKTRVRGPWDFGKVKQQGKRTDLSEVVESLKDVGLKNTVLAHPETFIKYSRGIERYYDILAEELAEWSQPTVYILYGKSRMGKNTTVYSKWKISEVARAMYQKDGDSYKIWFQNYLYQPCILLDEFAPIKCPLDQLKMLLDGYPCDMNIKGSSKIRYGCKEIYILTNKNPKEFYTSADHEDYQAFVNRINEVWHFEIRNQPVKYSAKEYFN